MDSEDNLVTDIQENGEGQEANASQEKDIAYKKEDEADSFFGDKQITAKIREQIEKNNQNITFLNIFRHEYTNNGIITGDDAYFQGVTFGEKSSSNGKKSEKGLADKPEQLEKWITGNYGKFDISFLIACAVFSELPYYWINDASEKLYLYLCDEEKSSVGKTARAQNVRVFGAEICQGIFDTYTGQIEVDCIRFKKNEQVNNVLRVIWNEFPQMREGIVSWLQEFILNDRQKMSERARDMLSYFANLDYHYFSHKMIKQINKANTIYSDLVLVQIIVSLYSQQQHTNNLDNMLKSWSKSQNIHCLLAAIYICVILEDKGEYMRQALCTYLAELYRAVQKRRNNEFVKEKINFFAAGMRKVLFYRLLIEELYDMSQQNTTKRELNDMCILFFELLCADIMLSHFDEEIEEEAVFVKLVSIKSSFRTELCFMWNIVWKRREYRIIFYDVLGQYFSFMPSWVREEKIQCFVNAAFMEEYTAKSRADFVARINMKTKKYDV